MRWKEGAGESIASHVMSLLDEPGMITEWYLVVNVVDGEGDDTLAVQCAPDQRTTATLGLLDWAQIRERGCTKRVIFNDDD